MDATVQGSLQQAQHPRTPCHRTLGTCIRTKDLALRVATKRNCQRCSKPWQAQAAACTR